MKQTINNLGKYGIIKDIDPAELPTEAWSDGNNVRCQDGTIRSFDGHSELTTPIGDPKYLLAFPSGSNMYWVYPTDTTATGTSDSIYIYNGSTHTDISNGVYTSNAWNACILNAVAILNNGVDNPQYWTGTGVCADLIYDGSTTWATQGYSAKIIRSYKNFLFALNITDSGTNYPHLIHWSNPADPNDIPDSWDYTSTSNESGRTELTATSGYLIDAVPLRDSLVIYKEDSITLCNYVGGTFQFSFQSLSDEYGLLSQDCAVDIGGKHFCVGKNYVYLHDGNTITPIMDSIIQDWFADELDADNYEETFVVNYQKKSEVWICYPKAGSSNCDAALVYNTRTGAISIRELPDLVHAEVGIVVDSIGETWDSSMDSWDSDDGTWGSRTYSPTATSLVGAAVDDLYKFDDGNQFDGTNAECIAERTGLIVGGTSEVNTVTRIFPRMKGGAVTITVGSQMTPNDAVRWATPVSFQPGVDHKVDVLSTGALHAIKIESNADIFWELAGYEAHYERAGHI